MKFLRILLFPFAIVYDFVTTIRNIFFDIGIFKQTSFQTPIIIVGNLSVGGTGKTPQIEYLIRLLKDRFKVAVLSRGYKRNTKGYLLLNNSHTALNVGDEPLQYYKKFGNISVAVDANRVEGASNLIVQKSPEVILLDDAYQHRKIKGSFYILLTKYNDLFVDDFLLPTGNLRESSRGASRTDVMIITKCPENLTLEHQNSIKKRLEKFTKKIFFTTISYGKIISIHQELSIGELKNYTILLITGIANPVPLLAYLDANNYNFKHLKYKDHHHFSSNEITEIHQEFSAIETNKKIILTTEKDYTRLQGKLDNLHYITIETKFLAGCHSVFDQEIINHIQQNRC